MTAATQSAAEQGLSRSTITIDNVTKVFGEDTATPFRALKSVSMDIKAGEFVSVVGPSGCGKSTLMLMIAGLRVTTHSASGTTTSAIAPNSIRSPLPSFSSG